MPLEMSPKIALNGIASQVKSVDRGNGVLLLVDMGSLSTFSTKLTEKTNVPVKTIDMVTTAMVLEAARKTALIDCDLKTVYQELREFNGYSRTVGKVNERQSEVQNRSDRNEKAIIAICSTGQGTARKIKDLLDKILVDNLIDDITVIAISVVNMKEQIAKIQQKYRIVMTTGIVNPQVAAPFISLESLLQGGGEEFINRIEKINSRTAPETEALNDSESLTKKMSQKYLGQYFTFINPEKVGRILWDYCNFIEERCEFKLSNTFKISLIMHMAGAIERCLLHSEMSVDAQRLSKIRREKMYLIVKQTNKVLNKKLNLNLSDSEIYYIVELFKTEKEKSHAE
jgi:transcriptional regulatory protein LevR